MYSTTETSRLIATEAEAAAALADVQRLEPEADQLATDLEATRALLKEAHERRAEAQKVLDAIAREPRDRKELETIIVRLRLKLAKGPQYPGDFAARSVTRREVGFELDALEADNRMSVSDKLSKAKQLSIAFEDRRHRDQRQFATLKDV